ncbi:MAG TPA: 50S ribosomal protein L13 [Patescibacteria group bacterium]|nr:50S ribosomal protein L13 [Patescibacteria group bacterium]
MPKPNKALNTITIDAAGQSLGRVASEVATKLRGKHLVWWRPNVVPSLHLKVVNVSKLRFSGGKLDSKKYYRFSGYPSGLKLTTLRQEFTKDPVRLFRRVVAHMLPKNKLNSRFLKNLTIIKSDDKLA